MNKIKTVVNNVLSIVFPHKEPLGLPSVFIQETWLEKIMRPTQIQDYLWNRNNEN